MLVDPTWMKKRLRQYEPRVFYFDLIECLRKLCLVGLSVFFEKGSSQNLAFGVLVTSTFLCLTARLSPYVLVSDDLLAIAAQAALLLTLCLAIMLKSARDLAAYRPEALAEVEGFQSRVGSALIAIAAAPIALAILLALIDLGAASALARSLRRGARRPSGGGNADSFGRRIKHSTASFGRRIKRAASFDRRAKPQPRATPPSFAAGFVISSAPASPSSACK